MKRTFFTIYLWVYIFINFNVILFLLIPFSLIMYPFDTHQKWSNKLMMIIGRTLLNVMPGWQLKIFGTERYDGKEARVFVCNHQSFLDMALQAQLPYHFKWVSKKELFSIPIMGWFMYLTKQLSVIRGKSSAYDLLHQALPLLQSGISVSIFPEGTRTRNVDELLPFKKGAFLLAKAAGVKIQPLVLDGTFHLNQPDDWRFSDKGELQLHVLEPLDPNYFATVDELTEATRTMIKERLDEIRTRSFAEAKSVAVYSVNN